MDLFRQNIKKICLLIAFQQSLSSSQKTTDFRHYWQILVKNCCGFIAGNLKAFYSFFFFNFLHIDPSNDFCFCKFFAKGLRGEGERLKLKFWSSEIVKIGRDQHNYCRYGCLEPNKISLLAVAILFLLTFFNLILDAPHTVEKFPSTIFPHSIHLL